MSEENEKQDKIKKPNEKERSINDFLGRQSNISKEIMDEEVCLMIIKDLLPISFVEGEGFRDLINTIDPDYAIPGI